ncbi:MAG TPA: hypothetical protein VID27_15975 [Blastocatellia bacterium]
MSEVVKRSKMRISFAMVGLAFAALIITYAGVAVVTAIRTRDSVPRLAIDSMVRALRTHHQQTGRFPADFRELEARVWKHKQPQDFGADGRTLTVANYYYIYHLVDARTATIWAVPTGPRREEASTHFLVLTPEWLRRWRGAPLELDEVVRLRPVPDLRDLAVLGLTEQSPIDLRKRKP